MAPRTKWPIKSVERKMNNDLIQSLKYIGFDYSNDDIVGTYIFTLGECEKLKISCHVSSYGLYYNDEYLGGILSAFEISKILKERFNFPFNLEKDEITTDYLEELGFEHYDDSYTWHSIFSPLLIKLKEEDLMYEVRVNNEFRCYVNSVNMFEWFLEGVGLLRVLK